MTRKARSHTPAPVTPLAESTLFRKKPSLASNFLTNNSFHRVLVQKQFSLILILWTECLIALLCKARILSSHGGWSLWAASAGH